MNSNIPYIDLHTHQPESGDTEVLQIVNLMAGSNPPEDLRYFSLGIHPWQLLHAKETSLELAMIRQLEMSGLAAIGEAGLDKAIGITLREQIPVFRMQADLAAAMGLPLIVHAVKSYAEIIEVRKEITDPSPWIIHGFSGHPQMASQLVQQGFYLSFGHALTISGSKASAAIKNVPPDRIFLETDESNFTIREIYHQASVLLGLKLEDLRNLVGASFKQLFRPAIS